MIERITGWKCSGCDATFKSAAEFLRWETPKGEMTGHRRRDQQMDYQTGEWFGSGEEIVCGPIVAVVAA